MFILHKKYKKNKNKAGSIFLAENRYRFLVCDDLQKINLVEVHTKRKDFVKIVSSFCHKKLEILFLDMSTS